MQRVIFYTLLALPLTPLPCACTQEDDTNNVVNQKKTNERVPTQTKITISKETTRITQPLTEDGYVDYVAAFNDHLSKGVTPETNAAVACWQAVGPDDVGLGHDEKFRKRFFNSLEIDEPPTKGKYFVSLWQMAQIKAVRNDMGTDADAVFEIYNRHLSEVMSAPWKAEAFPSHARWIEANEDVLDRLLAVLHRKHSYIPQIPCKDEMILAVRSPFSSSSREVARILVTRAMSRAGVGDIDSAWQNLLACYRLASPTRSNGFLIDRQLGIALEWMACSGCIALAQNASMMPGQTIKLGRDLEGLAQSHSLVGQIDVAERYMFLDLGTNLARGTPRTVKVLELDTENTGESLAQVLSTNEIDWSETAKIGNLWYDRMVEAARMPEGPRRIEALAAVQESLEKAERQVTDKKQLADVLALEESDRRKAVSKHVACALLAIIAPNGHQCEVSEARARSMVDFARITLALAAYHTEHSEFPENLASLSPRYLPDVPIDRFSHSALQYKKADQGYVIYSFGPDGRDDSGYSRGDRCGDDVSVRFRRKPD